MPSLVGSEMCIRDSTRICLHTSAEILRYSIRVTICTRNGARLHLSYDAGASRGRREAGGYVCCWCGVVWDAEGGGGLPVRRHSYGGHRVELWRVSDWLTTTKKQLQVKQSRQTRVYLCFYPDKNRRIALWTNGRARGVRVLHDFRLYLFLAPNRQASTFFWPLHLISY